MTNRERRHVACLRKRRDFLRERIARSDERLSYDAAESAALTWAITTIEIADQEGVLEDLREMVPR